MGEMTIDRSRRSPNFNGRTGRPDAVVLHDTATDGIASPLDWTLRPEARVSYHYLVGRDGRVYETVDPDRRAWHAGEGSLWGRPDPNSWSIGLAFVDVDRPGKPLDPYPEVQLDAAAQVVAELCGRYGIALNRIVGHEHVAPGRKVDPGADFPWKAFLLDVAFRLGIAGGPLDVRNHDGGST